MNKKVIAITVGGVVVGGIIARQVKKWSKIYDLRKNLCSMNSTIIKAIEDIENRELSKEELDKHMNMYTTIFEGDKEYREIYSNLPNDKEVDEILRIIDSNMSFWFDHIYGQINK